MPQIRESPQTVVSSVPSVPAKSRVTFLDRWLTRSLLQRLGQPAIAIVLWNGEPIGDTEYPQARVHISSRRALMRLLVDPSLGFGDAFSSGQIEVEGELMDLCDAIERSLTKKHSFRKPKRRAFQNDLRVARNNVHRHYDISNEFYRFWLDEQMVYTCAYFEHPDMSLEEAQLAKLDYVCRKLRLKPDQQVVEAGCGWGSLALHMARYYGARVRAFNISHEQITYARERADAEGLTSRVEFIEDDWRNISGRYNTFVSVGMLEHVGTGNYELLGEIVRNSLRPDGLGLIHTIGRNVAQPLDHWTQHRIFPGANPPSLRQMMDIFEHSDFSVLDVENLRLHYARTLEHWLDRFNENVDTVREMFDERFVRMWSLYLSASISAFRSSSLQLFQVVFSRAVNNNIPWTRDTLYTNGAFSCEKARLQPDTDRPVSGATPSR
jgi:cyclopropane-fatty-acyl-phospholipid synthase